jgi:tRNA G18 (ribose-2'-O)-methylase SpoU
MMGTEGRGLSDEALTAADGVVTIPLERDVESLNVAVAAGILLTRLGGCFAQDDRGEAHLWHSSS